MVQTFQNINPIRTGGASGDLHPTFFKVAKNWIWWPYMILKRKIELFTRKFLMYVPFQWDLPFFGYLVPNFFFTPTVAKDFFSKSCKTPKTAENRDTIKTKVVELSILVCMQPFKIWKKRKENFFRKFFCYLNDIEKIFFGQKNRKSSLIHQNDGLGE